MALKIAVLGTGYVGLVSAVGLADFGNTVTGVDIDRNKVEKLNSGVSTIYEIGIEEYLRRNLKAERLSFTSDIGTAIRESDIIFIAVGTPENDNGSADLSQVKAVLKSIAENLNGYKIVVTKSTVPVGTNRYIRDELKRQSGSTDFDVVSNPEFLREGRAVQDFFHPDRIVVGYESERVRKYIEEIFRPLYLIQTPFVWCNLETAELTKYASNAFLATKITFINQMANLAEEVGADIHTVAKTMGMDGRISPKFLHPGPGYGGSCFPKDTKAIASTGEQYKVDMSLIREVIRANEDQKLRMVTKLQKLFDGSLQGRIIVLLGVAFKAETDDIRESPSIAIGEKLLEQGAVVRVHDPKALENFRKLFGSAVEYYEDVFEALQDADGFMICTEWNEYRNLDLDRIKLVMKGKKVLDARNVLDWKAVVRAGFTYDGVGRGDIAAKTVVN